jgi:hypothetical protein
MNHGALTVEFFAMHLLKYKITQRPGANQGRFRLAFQRWCGKT